MPTCQMRAKVLIEDNDEKVVELLEVGVPETSSASNYPTRLRTCPNSAYQES